MKLNTSHPKLSSEFIYKTPVIKKRAIEVPGRPVKKQPTPFKFNPDNCISLFKESSDKENLDPNRESLYRKSINIQKKSKKAYTNIIDQTLMRTPPHTAIYHEFPQRPVKAKKDNFSRTINGGLSLFDDEHNHNKEAHIINISQNNFTLPPADRHNTSSGKLAAFGSEVETSIIPHESARGITSMQCMKKTTSIDSLLSGATTHDHSDQSDDEFNLKKQKSEIKTTGHNDKLGTCKIQFAPPAMLQQIPKHEGHTSLFRPIHPVMQNNMQSHIIHKPIASRPTSGIAFRTTFNK